MFSCDGVICIVIIITHVQHTKFICEKWIVIPFGLLLFFPFFYFFICAIQHFVASAFITCIDNVIMVIEETKTKVVFEVGIVVIFHL